MRVWWRLVRPFTLLPPALGMLSGAASAYGARHVPAALSTGEIVLLSLGGALMAALLNGASNVLNQVHDLQLDRVNKPHRPLPSGAVSVPLARTVAAALYIASIALAFLITPGHVPEVGIIVVLTAFLTWAYSAPPLRWRRIWWLAPLVIAIPRGWLLKVCGWASLAPVGADAEPWILGGLFFLFIVGCASTKDFGDMEGDRLGGIETLPLRFGPVRAAWLMAPFYVLPWLLFAALPWIHVSGRPLLTVDPACATLLGVLLAVHGTITARALVLGARKTGDRDVGDRAWRHLYLLMMEAQVGVAAVYLWPILL